jgi:hypothetical protein
MYNEPLSPALDVPVLKIIMPLTPLTPAFDVTISTDPLDVEDPYPLCMTWFPPDANEDEPEDNTISPPVPLLPEPTVKYNDPPRPD